MRVTSSSMIAAPSRPFAGRFNSNSRRFSYPRAPLASATPRPEPSPRASSRDEPHFSVTKRLVLLSGSALLIPSTSTGPAVAAPRETTTMPVDQLSVFQKNAQRTAFTKRVEGELTKHISMEDGPDLVRLVLAEASTYDPASKQGGFDGSIFLNQEEASRPQNKEFQPIIAKLREAKEAIDKDPEAQKSGPISYADLLTLSSKVGINKEFAEYRFQRAGKKADRAQIIANAYATTWPTIRLGRLDAPADAPTPPTRLPARDAPVGQIFDFFYTLAGGGAAPGPFKTKPLFNENVALLLWASSVPDGWTTEVKRLADGNPAFANAVKKYLRSRETTTRNVFEVDMIDAHSRATSLGAQFAADKYLAPETSLKLRL